MLCILFKYKNSKIFKYQVTLCLQEEKSKLFRVHFLPLIWTLSKPRHHSPEQCFPAPPQGSCGVNWLDGCILRYPTSWMHLNIDKKYPECVLIRCLYHLSVKEQGLFVLFSPRLTTKSQDFLQWKLILIFLRAQSCSAICQPYRCGTTPQFLLTLHRSTVTLTLTAINSIDFLTSNESLLPMQARVVFIINHWL